MNVVVWLRSLGLGKYEAAFRENEIDETILPNLTTEDLRANGRNAGPTSGVPDAALCPCALHRSGARANRCCAF
jgi:hypothetical protein